MTASFGVWFLALLAGVVVAPYVCRVPPKSRRHWMYLVAAIAFVGWLLVPLMSPLRSEELDRLPLCQPEASLQRCP